MSFYNKTHPRQSDLDYYLNKNLRLAPLYGLDCAWDLYQALSSSDDLQIPDPMDLHVFEDNPTYKIAWKIIYDIYTAIQNNKSDDIPGIKLESMIVAILDGLEQDIPNPNNLHCKHKENTGLLKLLIQISQMYFHANEVGRGWGYLKGAKAIADLTVDARLFLAGRWNVKYIGDSILRTIKNYYQPLLIAQVQELEKIVVVTSKFDYQAAMMISFEKAVPASKNEWLSLPGMTSRLYTQITKVISGDAPVAKCLSNQRVVNWLHAQGRKYRLAARNLARNNNFGTS